MTRLVIIVQARMCSKRLPGKVLMEVDHIPLLQYQLDSLETIAAADEVIVATSTRSENDPIASFCRSRGTPVYRGSEENVLDRYYQTAKTEKADVIVRICADCPLIDPAVVDKVIQSYLIQAHKYDYASNIITRTYPRGMDTEVFSMAALEKAHGQAKRRREQEHVTLFFYENPQLFRLLSVAQDGQYNDQRWTVDEPEDFLFVRHVLKELNARQEAISMQAVLKILQDNPDWIQFNLAVQQRKV